MNTTLPIFLTIAAAAQLAVAALNLGVVRLLQWKDELRRVPLLMREVFYVHSWFISLILIIFGVFTIRFADRMSSDLEARWLAGGIALFWGFRTALQMFYYSSSHWRGKSGRTVIHIILLVLYGGMAVTYFLAAASGLIAR